MMLRKMIIMGEKEKGRREHQSIWLVKTPNFFDVTIDCGDCSSISRVILCDRGKKQKRKKTLLAVHSYFKD